MPFEIEVRVAGCFGETTAVAVDCVEGCAVGDDAFSRCDPHDRAVSLVEGGYEARFVAGVGVVPDPERGEAADERAGDFCERREESLVEEGGEEEEREG